MLGAHMTFEVRKGNVLHTNAAQARTLGRHFVVGYSSFEEVAALAEKGLIAGVYVTRHNIAGRAAEALKSEIAALQARRRRAGLAPLMIAADQEGGIVLHQSPAPSLRRLTPAWTCCWLPTMPPSFIAFLRVLCRIRAGKARSCHAARQRGAAEPGLTLGLRVWDGLREHDMLEQSWLDRSRSGYTLGEASG
jgi:hypothetical protein